MSAHRRLWALHPSGTCDTCDDERDQRDADEHTEAEDAVRAGEATGGSDAA